MKIFYINNSGSGFADQIEVPEGTTLGQLFAQKMPGCHPGDYLIRKDRLPATSEEPLADGCRVSITPTKIEGCAICLLETEQARSLIHRMSNAMRAAQTSARLDVHW